jgi:hypothetical protein
MTRKQGTQWLAMSISNRRDGFAIVRDGCQRHLKSILAIRFSSGRGPLRIASNSGLRSASSSPECHQDIRSVGALITNL